MKKKLIFRKKYFFKFIRAFGEYLFGITALKEIPIVLRQGNLNSALTYLSKKYKFYNPAPIKFLKLLYPYLIEQDIEYSALSTLTAKKKLVLHVCWWGDNYFEKVKNCLFPSLLANNNLPILIKQYETSILIHCDSDSKKVLEDSQIYKTLSQMLTIRFILLPPALINALNSCCKYPPYGLLNKLNMINRNIKYFLLGGLQTSAFKIALKEKAIISFLMPDMVISDSFYREAFKLLEGKKAVLITTCRANYQSLREELLRFCDLQPNILSVDATSLVQLHLNHLHSHSKKQVIAETNSQLVISAQLLFKLSNGYVIRAFHYHPILLDCSEITHHIPLDYYPIDNSVLSSVFLETIPYEAQISVCDDSSLMHCIELSDEEENNTQQYSHKLNYEQMVRAFQTMVQDKPQTFNTAYNRYLITFRYKMLSQQTITEDKNTYVNDNDFIKEIVY